MVTAKLPAVPTVNVAAPALVIVGASLTVSLKSCVTVPPRFAARSVSVTTPPAPGAGVPAIDAVPSPLSRNVSPAGSVPDAIESAGIGNGAGEPPMAFTVNATAEPTVELAAAALWNLGGTSSVYAVVGSPELALLSCVHASSTIPAGTCTLICPDWVMPDTSTV